MEINSANKGKNPPSTPNRDRASTSEHHRTNPRWIKRALEQFLSHPVSLAVFGLCGLTLLVWNLGFKLPASGDLIAIQARPSPALPDSSRTKTALNPEAIANLRQDVNDARSFLVADRTELQLLLAKAKKLATRQGWRLEYVIPELLIPVESLPHTEIIPARLTLTNLLTEEQNVGRPAYFRFLAFLRQFHGLGKKMEINDLIVTAGPHQLQSAEATLHIWIQQDNATPSPR